VTVAGQGHKVDGQGHVVAGVGGSRNTGDQTFSSFSARQVPGRNEYVQNSIFTQTRAQAVRKHSAEKN